MKTNIRLKLVVIDRVGMMADVAAVLAACALNIVAMEVEKQGRESDIYLETEGGDTTPAIEEIFTKLKAIPNLLQIKAINTLPLEKREKRFQILLDNISDGILSIDEGGELAIINRVAKEILDCHDAEAIGKNIRDLNLPDKSILECLEGHTYTNAKRNVISKKGRFQFLASGKVIADSQGQIVGAVEVMKNMQEIRELASAVVQPFQVSFSDMVGQSRAIREAIAFAQKIATTDGIVSIRGESGTGKELFASAVHMESRRPGPFVPINCAALPEALLESELFGYVGGAFSGAKKEGKPGLFEIARDGTIFLDEIAEMPLSLQAKMLRVIQESKVRRIGGAGEVAVNARIVTATNKNLEKLVQEGRFREDLYYRINVFPIYIPPLRERIEDIPLLVDHFLFQINSRLGKKVQSLTSGAMTKLCGHHWPGNVREFRNVIERAAILSTSEQINEDCVLFSFEVGRSMGALPRPASELSPEVSLHELLARYEMRIIAEALEQSESKRKAASLLGVSHTALLKKLKKYRLFMETKHTSGN